MILRSHIPYHADVLALEGFLGEPVLVFGHNDCAYEPADTAYRRVMRHVWLGLDHWRRGVPMRFGYRAVPEIPERFRRGNYHEILRAYGAGEVRTLDFFDPRAEIRHDMNLPIPEEWHGAFATVIDIGNLEHVFDTRQCLWNLLRMVRVGGHFFLHTPCAGYFNHGLHTSSPECLLGAIEGNGFEIRYLAYSTPDGMRLAEPTKACDAILWVAAQKREEVAEFVNPQQGRWAHRYREMADGLGGHTGG